MRTTGWNVKIGLCLLSGVAALWMASAAMGQESSLPADWQSLSLTELQAVATDLSAAGAAGERDLGNLSRHVATLYTDAAAAGPIGDWDAWLDMARLGGRFFPAAVRTAMGSDIRLSLVATPTAVANISGGRALSVTVALSCLRQSQGKAICEDLSTEAAAAWASKLKTAVNARTGGVGSLSFDEAQAVVSSLEVHQDKAGAVAMAAGWTGSAEVRARVDGVELAGLARQAIGIDAEAGQGVLASVGAYLESQLAEEGAVSSAACQAMARAWDRVKDRLAARQWAVRSCDLGLSAYDAAVTQQGSAARAASSNGVLVGLAGMTRIVARGDGGEDQARAILEQIDQRFAARPADASPVADECLVLASVWMPLDKSTAQVWAGKAGTRLAAAPLRVGTAPRYMEMTGLWRQLGNAEEAANWAMKAHDALMAEPAKSSLGSGLLFRLIDLPDLLAACGREQEALAALQEVDAALAAQDEVKRFAWHLAEEVAYAWLPFDVAKAREWAMRTYLAALGTEEVRQGRTEGEFVRITTLLRRARLIDRVSSDAIMVGLEPVWNDRHQQKPLQWETCLNISRICRLRGDQPKAQEWALRAYQALLGTESGRAVAGEGQLLRLLSVVGEQLPRDQEYPEFAQVVASLAQQERLTAGAWRRPNQSALPGRADAVVGIVQAELTDASGVPRLAVTEILACTYRRAGQLPQWRATLDQHVAASTADTKALWLIARSFADVVASASPSPLAGQGHLDQALTVATSPAVQYRVAAELANGYAAIGRHGEALALLDSIAGQFEETVQAGQLAGLRNEIAKDQAEYPARQAQLKAEQEQWGRQAWLEELQSRLAEAQAAGDAETVAIIQRILSAQP